MAVIVSPKPMWRFPDRFDETRISIPNYPGEERYICEDLSIYKPLCFGTLRERSTDPIGPKLSPFQKKVTIEYRPNIGPATYYNPKNDFVGIMSRKTCSQLGTGFFASKTVERKYSFLSPPSTKYQKVYYHRKRKSKSFPFNSKLDRFMVKMDCAPTPGTYNIDKRFLHKYTEMRKGKVVSLPCVETFCSIFTNHVCLKCKAACEKDYWHENFKIFLCHLCWLEEKHRSHSYTLDELKKFKKIRTCQDIHVHEGTTITKTLCTKRRIIKLRNLENYLCTYIPD